MYLVSWVYFVVVSVSWHRALLHGPSEPKTYYDD